jgi:hypothetical protein
MSGAKMSVTDPMSGETTPSRDDPMGPRDAISPLDLWGSANYFLRIAADGGIHDSEADRDRVAKPFAETKAVQR